MPRAALCPSAFLRLWFLAVEIKLLWLTKCLVWLIWCRRAALWSSRLLRSRQDEGWAPLLCCVQELKEISFFHVCFPNKGRRDKRRKEEHSFAPEKMTMNASVYSRLWFVTLELLTRFSSEKPGHSEPFAHCLRVSLPLWGSQTCSCCARLLRWRLHHGDAPSRFCLASLGQMGLIGPQISVGSGGEEHVKVRTLIQHGWVTAALAKLSDHIHQSFLLEWLKSTAMHRSRAGWTSSADSWFPEVKCWWKFTTYM